jgi:hypothetical protein
MSAERFESLAAGDNYPGYLTCAKTTPLGPNASMLSEWELSLEREAAQAQGVCDDRQ